MSDIVHIFLATLQISAAGLIGAAVFHACIRGFGFSYVHPDDFHQPYKLQRISLKKTGASEEYLPRNRIWAVLTFFLGCAIVWVLIYLHVGLIAFQR